MADYVDFANRGNPVDVACITFCRSCPFYLPLEEGDTGYLELEQQGKTPSDYGICVFAPPRNVSDLTVDPATFPIVKNTWGCGRMCIECLCEQK